MPHIPSQLPPSRGVPPEIAAAINSEIDKRDNASVSGLAGEAPRAKAKRISMGKISLKDWTVEPGKIAEQLLGRKVNKDGYTGRLVPTGTPSH